MGYEHRFFIVDKSSITDNYNGEGKIYASVVAMFNFSGFKIPEYLFKTPTDCFIYSDDGNTPILEDCYGNPLTEISISDAAHAFNKMLESQENPYSNIDYNRRLKSLVGLLNGFDPNDWKNLVVLHYVY